MFYLMSKKNILKIKISEKKAARLCLVKHDTLHI